MESAEELAGKEIGFTESGKKELEVLCSAVSEILTLSYKAFIKNDLHSAGDVEPLEQVIDGLKAKLRNAHIKRLKEGNCSIEAGFIWLDIITNLERTADHCSNIAGCIIETSHNNLNMHESLRIVKSESVEFKNKYAFYTEKYHIKAN